MAKKKYSPSFFLDMSFGEALERFIGTKPQELEAVMKKSRAKKLPGAKKKKAPGSDVKSGNVVRLRDRRKPNYR
jgi:hypothetical protein